MNILDYEIHNTIQENIPYIIDAYAKVYGEKHRSLIEERVNRIIYVTYNDIDGIKDYINFIENSKERELFIKFLQKIGVDISKDQAQNYVKGILDENIEDMIYHYIGIYDAENLESSCGFNAWRYDDEPEYVKQEKIEFINFLRGENETPITVETFQDFCKTDEYKEILEKAKEYIKVYDGIVKEYGDTLKELEPYKEYVEEENKRRNNIQTQKRNMIYMQIEDKLTDDIKNYLNERYSSIDEKSSCFLDKELGKKSYLEYFSKEDENKLNSDETSSRDKDLINYYRYSYFKSIGLEISDNKEDFKKQCKEYERMVPTQELIEEITRLKEKAYSECQKEFICNSKDFITNIKMFANTEKNIEVIYNKVKNSQICITNGNSDQYGFVSILYLTIRKDCGGILEHILLHEMGHAIETEDILGKNDYKSGFEIGVNTASRNSYNDEYRKYERLNETIRDMLTIEASEILHEQGIYIFEQKELISDAKNVNTHSICKDLLKTFLSEYREEIIGTIIWRYRYIIW